MDFKRALNELQDIPIRDFQSDNKPNFDKVEKPPQEVDRTFRFNPNDYHLKKGKLTASSEEELEEKVDAFLEKTSDRMSTVYNYSTDGLSAFIVYYDREIASLEEKYKAALHKKIDEFAKKYSSETPKTKEQTGSTSNIQKVIATLSAKSLKDLEKYVNILKQRDSYDK